MSEKPFTTYLVEANVPKSMKLLAFEVHALVSLYDAKGMKITERIQIGVGKVKEQKDGNTE